MRDNSDYFQKIDRLYDSQHGVFKGIINGLIIEAVAFTLIAAIVWNIWALI